MRPPLRKRLLRRCISVLLLWASSFSELIASYGDDRTSLEQLGRRLFFDKRLSFNKTKSCASCHSPELAFTDGYRHSIGASGDLHIRNSSTLLNIAGRRSLTAADPTLTSLEAQLNQPLYNEQVIEMGIKGHEQEVLSRLVLDSEYDRLLDSLGRGRDELNFDLVREALASYTRSLISRNSAYDRYLRNGDSNELSPAALRGMSIFFNVDVGCSNCHGGPDFDRPQQNRPHMTKNGFFTEQPLRVNTKYGADFGLFDLTGVESDRGKFRIPTLRNVAVTGPYMHDGSVATLNEVIDRYGANGKEGQRITDGVLKPALSDSQRRDLLHFLESLTDLSYLNDPYYTSPFALEE